MKNILISGVVLLALLAIKITDPKPVEQVRNLNIDYYLTQSENRLSESIFLINIAEETLGVRGQWPLPRQNYAQLIQDLRLKNAGVIGFTILFPEEDRNGGDNAFSSLIEGNGIVLSQQPSPNGRNSQAPFVGTATLGDGVASNFAYNYSNVISNIPMLQEQAWGVGMTNGAPEVDGLTRRIPLATSVNKQIYPSFSLEMIRALSGSKSYTMKVEPTGIENFRLPPYEVIPTDSTGSIYLDWNVKFRSYDLDKDKLPYDFGGMPVIIGITAEGIVPQIPTPDGLKSPHEVQAIALETLMNGSNPSRPIWAPILETTLLLLLGLLVIFSVSKLPLVVSSLLSGLALLSSVAIPYYLWNSSLLLIDFSYNLISIILLFSITYFLNFYEQYRLRQQIKGQFGTYLSPIMVDMLVKDPSLMKLGGERRNMTFMFMDIVGFTPISEFYKNKDDPEGLVEIINNYLDRMTKIILKHGGTIDKFMGDCIMAFWNAPLQQDNHAELAIVTATEICEAADELIQELEEKGLPRIDVGIGINTGTCIVGNMGSTARFDYSVIGDAVNLASRLEGQTRNYDGIRVLLSEGTYRECPNGSFSEIDRITVKGKSEKITIYTPIRS